MGYTSRPAARYIKRFALIAALACAVIFWNFIKNGDARPITADPTPLSAACSWAELPTMHSGDGVLYATHWVSADGSRIADGRTSGRVRNFSIAFDTRRRQPLWVAAPMHEWYRSPRNTGRTDYWNFDPTIPESAQPHLRRSYRGDYSRGHLIASADRLRGWALNAQTFYYTNMAPQLIRGFNDSRSVWTVLEQRVQRWGDAATDTLYVVTGSAFLGSGPGGGIDTTFDNDGHPVPVPSHFYKVLLSSKGHTGKGVSGLRADQLRAVGFWIPHTRNEEPLSAAHMRSVAEIERLVGLEFFPTLTEEARSVKSTFDASEWGF